MSKLAERLRGGRALETKKVSETKQFLTFVVNGEEYGVAILSVQEIRGWEPVMSIPNAPAYLRGVINLRGAVIPIVDLRTRFGLSQSEVNATTVVIFLRVISSQGEKPIGVVVDAVSEVYDVEASQVQPAPDLEKNAALSFITGIATMKDKMVSLLDIERLFDVDAIGMAAVMRSPVNAA